MIEPSLSLWWLLRGEVIPRELLFAPFDSSSVGAALLGSAVLIPANLAPGKQCGRQASIALTWFVCVLCLVRKMNFVLVRAESSVILSLLSSLPFCPSLSTRLFVSSFCLTQLVYVWVSGWVSEWVISLPNERGSGWVDHHHHHHLIEWDVCGIVSRLAERKRANR